MSFVPGEIRGGRFRVDIGTAGSATLALQALLPVALSAPEGVTLEVVGGTDVSHSPGADYFEHVFCRILRGIGCELDVSVLDRGFYPRGGGCIRLDVRPWDYGRPLELTGPGGVTAVEAYSIASEHLRKQEVAERQAGGLIKSMAGMHPVEVNSPKYAAAPSVGSSLTAVAVCEKSVLGSCVLGDRALRAEEVGRRASEELLGDLASGGALDRHMADQIVPYIALSGGFASVAAMSSHARTNVEVVNLFGYGVRADGLMLLR